MGLWIKAAENGELETLQPAYVDARGWLIKHESDRPKSLGTLFGTRLRERFSEPTWLESECDNGENPFRPLYRVDHLLRLSALMRTRGSNGYRDYPPPRPLMTLQLLWDVLVEKTASSGEIELQPFNSLVDEVAEAVPRT
jgi:hypothetical protein